MSVFHVVVRKKDGSFVHSKKEKESSAVKSAKMYVSVRGEPAGLVISNGKVVFAVPENPDKAFVQTALRVVNNSPEPPIEKKPKIESTPKIKGLAKEYDKFMKAGGNIPQSQKKADPCTIRILTNACLASIISQGAPLEAAKLVCEDSKTDIEALAIEIASGSKSLETAIQELAAGEVMTEEKTVETPTHAPPNVTKIMRGRKDKIFPKTRVRQDIGKVISTEEEEDLNSLKNRSIPDGIVIYTTKDVDDAINEILATAMGYEPQGLINSHYPAGIPGYDYKRNIPLVRPSYKVPVWKAFGGRIGNPSLLVTRIENTYPEEKVRIIIANGIELA